MDCARRGIQRHRSAIIFAAVATATLAGAASPARAATKTWSSAAAGTFNWSTAGGWTPANQPVNGDTANIVPVLDFNDRTLNYDAAATNAVTLVNVTVDQSGGGQM